MGDKKYELGKLLGDMAKGSKSISTLWATVTEHNDDGSFDCVSTNDGLEYFDVLPGLFSLEITPSLQSKCLIGIIGNSKDAFLIAAEEVDEIRINGDAFGGIVKAPELKKQVDKNTEVLKKIQQVFNNWSPVSQDGGAALKAQVVQFTNLPLADLSEIENENIKHG